jgi:hypothetical protein
MSLATQNLFLLDARKTAESTIVKINLLKNEFQLPAFWFVLNKENYNPNLFESLKNRWFKYLKKRKVKKTS